MESLINNSSILVTGANGGMGLETVKLLLNESPARIAMACRTEAKALSAIEEIEKTGHGTANLEPYGGFDMNSEASIEQAVSSLPQGQAFDIIFLQSGGAIFTEDYQFIEHKGQKIEKAVYQNALGGYLTLKYLEENGLIAPNARIVYAGGEGARGIPGLIEKPEFKSIDELRTYLSQGTKSYNPMNGIGTSKLISALLTIKLAEEDPNRTYLWFSPGLTSGTKGLNSMTGFKKYIMKHVAFPFFTFLGLAQNPQKAAAKYVDSLAGRIGQSGDVIGAPEGKALGKLVDQKPMNSAFTNQQLRNGLYNFVTGVMGYAVKAASKESLPKV